MTEITYFVTGVNRGIGRELVRQLLDEENTRVIGTVRAEIPEDLENSITKDPRLTILRLDYNDTDSFISIARELEKLNVGIDVFISNAALNESKGLIFDNSLEEFIRYFKINSVGPIELIKILKPYLMKKKTRKIVLTSSIFGSIGDFPDFLADAFPCSPYCVSKSALNSFGVQLSYELKPEGFTVINYHPGLIATKDPKKDPIKQKKGFQADKKFVEYFIDNSFDVKHGVAKELQVIKNVKFEDSGKFLTYDGSEVKY